MKQSTEFLYDPNEFEDLLSTCEVDDSVQESLKWIKSKDASILEAGCGIGRVVKYLNDMGYSNVKGIELNETIVAWINETFPELDVVSGDILNMPYPDNAFDILLSYGVVEHFPKGLHEPILSHYNALKPGGIAIVTVPSLNFVRRLSYWWYCNKHLFNFKANPVIRKIFNKPQLPVHSPSPEYIYYKHPINGKFFEYRLTPKEFKDACIKANFKLIKSIPIMQIDGLYHSFGAPLVTYEHRHFVMSPLGKFLNSLFSFIPFFHNHMHLCVLQKPTQS